MPEGLHVGATSRWQRNRISIHHVPQYIIVAHALVRQISQGHDFIEHHAVSPDVRLGREDAVGQALGGHPPHRKHACNAIYVVINNVY